MLVVKVGGSEGIDLDAVCRDIAALMDYEEMTVQQAADAVIQEKLTAMGGTGGVVAMDSGGDVAFSFNTTGMYRGYLKQGGSPVVAMYGGEEQAK